jgi:hypothetical protein
MSDRDCLVAANAGGGRDAAQTTARLEHLQGLLFRLKENFVEVRNIRVMFVWQGLGLEAIQSK